MTKHEIVEKIAGDLGLTKVEVQVIVQKFLDCIIDQLAHGKSIELRNFGVFEVSKRKDRMGRNPNYPGEHLFIPSRVVAKFRVGKKLKERVQSLRI